VHAAVRENQTLADNGALQAVSARVALSAKGKSPTANPLQGHDLASGADRDRTGDPLLAKQVLSQLSYRPKNFTA